MTKVSRRKKAQRTTTLSKLLRTCINCGEKGPHYYPPGLGTPGGFICQPKEENNARGGPSSAE